MCVCVLIASVKERNYNAVEIDIIGSFGRVFIVTNLPLPPNKYSGGVVSLSFYRPRFNAYTHVETENSSIEQIERSRINMPCEVRATLPVEKTIP